MEEKTTTLRNSPAPMLGWLIAPLAVMLAIAAIKVAGIDFDLNMNNMLPMLLIAVAAILGTVPRIVRNNDTVNLSSSVLSLATLGAAMVGHQAIIHLTDQGAFTALQFLVVTFGVFFFDSRGRHELATILTFAMVGVNVGMIAAGSYVGQLDTVYQMPDDTYISTLNLQRQALGYVFFSYLAMFTALGMLVAVLARGVINPEGDEGWFAKISSFDGSWNKGTLPLQVALLVWILAHAGSLCHFDSVSMADKLGVISIEGYHGHFGFWSAFFTGIIAIIVAGMAAEKWHTRSMFLASMWGLYLVSSWYESGMWESEQLEGTWGALIWLGFTFFICVGIYMISTHEKYGGWANLDDHEISGARKFWDAHWANLMIGLAFFFALVIRIQWYIVPSMNAYGTGGWDMTGGSDPWYMKRVVDYILANNAHLIFDADRSYPLGGVNPRPPLFTWSIALLAMILEPMLGDDAVWYAILGLPAIYGALTVYPIATIAKDNFGKATGVVAAWLIAFMPAHVSHSTWGLADHDAFVMLFISMGFMFWFKAIKYSGNERLTKTSSPRLSSMLESFSVVAKERRPAMAFAVLAGVSFGVASLAWKGFVVGPSILFLAYFSQVALNMFRRKDSTTLNAMFLVMLFSNLLMALPFYGHPQMDLVLDGTGLQPFLFVLGFTVVIAYVTTGFRDKPWLLVLGTLFVSAVIFFIILFVLKQLEISNAWDVLFTGSGYFAKTKVFGTVAEANAPDRGQLFAQLSPIVLVLALTMGFYAMWSTFKNKNQTHLFFAVWIFAASYMSWTAARFMFNATPAVAVLGAWGIVALWDKAGWQGLVKKWKKSGVRTPADRIAGARKAVWRTPSFSAILLIMVLLGGQQFTYGLDSAMPGASPQNHYSEADVDEKIFNIIPDALRWELAGFSVLDSSAYSGNWYLGSFGSSFNGQGWNQAHEWLADQDSQMPYSERPAFVSWWDYGFAALDTGEHPSVSDNFQSGIPGSGNMLLARSQADLVSMFIWQLSQGDLRYSQVNTGDYEMTSGFTDIISQHLNEEQYDLFIDIQEGLDFDMMKDLIDDYSFTVIQTNEAAQVQENGLNVMASGYHRVNGVVDDSTLYYRMYQDGDRILCDTEVSSSCSDGDWSDYDDANIVFNNNVRSGQETSYETTHYIFGDYWYTSDLRDEFASVSTHIHRHNTRIALVVQLLSDSLSESQIVDLYDDLIGLEDYYHVQDYEGLPGDMISRDHEIRYLAIDNRLYPRAGRYTEDYSYNQGQPMGIFGAPTILSGQDIGTFMDEVYETSRGTRDFEMTRAEVDEAMTNDFLDQQAGLEIDPLQVKDVRVDHNSEFFETMLARTYVGYGGSTLGIDTALSNPQPAQHFGGSGSPGSMLQQALPMPGAMMNHFVISNWYQEGTAPSLSSANTLVKILKYYSGAEISGTVTMEDDGTPLPGVRLLIERDAFSGEGAEDLDNNTYWIPIGFTDADANGQWSFNAPAGKIRVSAFVGTFDPEPARASINDGSFMQQYGDMLCDSHEEYNSQYGVCVPSESGRTVYPVTSILGNVANMTWLGDSVLNVTGEQANRTADLNEVMDIEVTSSGISGQLSWSGDELFDGEPIVDTTVILRNVHGTSGDISIVTTNGSFSTDETRILQGTGEATFTENGTFVSDGLASVVDFHGTFTRSISDGRTYVANGTWDGIGEIKASWIELSDSFDISCDIDSNNSDNITMPVNETICLKDDTGDLPIYLIAGEVVANGRFTSVGSTVLVQEYTGSSFEGIGTFEGTGTFNGTGRFTGQGQFSGEMVSPGSFYETGIVPGEYDVFASLHNGREVELPETVSIGIDPIYGISLSMPGSLITGNISDFEGNPISNATFEWIDLGLSGDNLTTITSDELGNYSYGPISAGDYQYRIDQDDDGYFEVNETITFNEESVVSSPMNLIPEMYDVSINLSSPVNETGADVVNVNNKTLRLIPLNAIGITHIVTANESGVAVAELAPGLYQIEDVDAEDYVLFSSLEVVDSDFAFDAEYSVSTEVNGTVLAYVVEYDENWTQADIDANSTLASGVLLTFNSGNLIFTSTTGVDGNFSVNLPGNHTFDVYITNTLNNYGAGFTTILDDQGAMDLGDIYLDTLYSAQGQLFLHDLNNTWKSSLFEGYNPVITATNSNGFSWNVTSDPMGGFEFRLPSGEYDFSVEEAKLNVDVLSDLQIPPLEFVEEINLTAKPSDADVKFYVFLDSADNESFEHGIPVSIDFTITSQQNASSKQSFNISDYGSVGLLETQLQPGMYTINVNYTTEDDNVSSDFNNFFVSKTVYVNPFLDEVQNLTIPFSDERLFTGKLSFPDGENYTTEFLLYNEEDDQWFTVTTNDTGNFSEYIPSGEWLIIVSPNDYDNSTFTLRQQISINADSMLRTDLNLAMVEVMNVKFTVLESLSSEPVEGARLVAVSQDGLGNVTLSQSFSDGNVSYDLMPGTWALSLNKSGVGKVWNIDISPQTTFGTADAVDGVVNLSVIEANVSVRIGGRVFWDLNNDNDSSPGEWVEGFNLTLLGANNTEFSLDVSTDIDGLWEAYVPVRDVYNITLTKDGYATTYYSTENESGFVVNDDSVINEIEVIADDVQVTGIVSTALSNPDMHLNGASVVLYSESGVDREPVYPTTSYDSGELSWSASVEPGNWIVVVQSSNTDENGGGISIGHLDANVLDGGDLEMSMSSGGWIELSTLWTDIELQEHHVANVGDSGTNYSITEPVSVDIDLGFEVDWEYAFDSNGTLRIILPVGSVTLSSEFTTIQHDRMLEMDYSAVQSGNIEQGILEMQLDYARKLNSETSITIDAGSIVNATFTNTAILNAEVSGEDYKVIEFDLDVEYLGTETGDVFTAIGTVGNYQDSDSWQVQFYNGTTWLNSSEFTLGIGDSLADTSVENQTTLEVRIIMSNVSTSLSLDTGHKISLDISSDSGLSSSKDITVQIPQNYGFELSDVIDEAGVAPGGTGSFSLTITNTGNGDDTYSIELADNLPTGWQITPTSSDLTISKDVFRTQQFSVFAPADFTSGEIEATITVTSEDGLTSETVTVTIVSSRISLSVDETLSQELTKVYESQTGSLIIPIENSGYRNAGAVIVHVNLTNDAGTKIIDTFPSQTISVPAGQTVNAVFELDPSSEKFNRFAISVDVLGEDSEYVEESIDSFDYQEETILDESEPTSSWFMIVIIILGLLVGYGGIKVARNKSSTRF